MVNPSPSPNTAASSSAGLPLDSVSGPAPAGVDPNLVPIETVEELTALARAMAARPVLLMADEVMAGLSSGEVDDILALLGSLNAQGVTIIMIEHIMRAVMRFSERLVVLDAGEKIAEGTPEAIVNNAAVERAYLGE